MLNTILGPPAILERGGGRLRPRRRASAGGTRRARGRRGCRRQRGPRAAPSPSFTLGWGRRGCLNKGMEEKGMGRGLGAMGGVIWWGGVPGALLLALPGAPPPAPHPGVQMGWCWLETAHKRGVYWGYLLVRISLGPLQKPPTTSCLGWEMRENTPHLPAVQMGESRSTRPCQELPNPSSRDQGGEKSLREHG